jgi:hypothetical protein
MLRSVERGDDPRRPATEPSVFRVEQHWAREALARGYIRARGIYHPGNLRIRKFIIKPPGEPPNELRNEVVRRFPQGNLCRMQS